MNDKLCMWEIYVPTTMNGKPIRTRYHRVWDAQVRAITGGLTIYYPAKGQWVDNGTVFIERMIPVRVACTKKQIEQIADLSIAYYQQRAVMYYLISEKVYIKRAACAI